MLKTRRTLVVVANLIRQTVVALSVVLLPFIAAAQTVVKGQNEPTLDVAAVQAAVDNGGSVLLVGTFNFGDTGRVLLRSDVDISGEIDGSGNPVTTIHGGDWPFYSPLPVQMPPTHAGPQVTVRYIHFHGAKGVAVHLAYTGGASIHNNRVTGMRGRLLDPINLTFRRSAVLIGPLDSRPRNVIEITPHLVSGPIHVRDNYFDSSGAEASTTTNAGAVFMAFLHGADVRIENNVSIGCTRNCMAVFDAIEDSDGQGSLVIAGNSITSDVKIGFTVPGARAPIGIDAAFNFNRTLGLDPNRRHIPTAISDNYVELNGRTSLGISSAMNGAILEGNNVVVHALSAGTTNQLSTTGGIIAAASHQLIFRNRIMGEGWNAIRIGGNVVGLARIDSVAQANNISGFKAFSSDFLLDGFSAFNTIIGDSGTVVDNGTNNAITGFRPVKGGVGDAVSEAEQYRHDVTEVLE
jgi:hypothetical protein